MFKAQRFALKNKRSPRCELCYHFGKNTYWHLTLHHVHGHPKDNDPEYIKILCKKCHTLVHSFFYLPDARGVIVKSYTS